MIWNRLGYVLAAIIVAGLVWLGEILIKTDLQLAMVAVVSSISIIAMAGVQILMRRERYTTHPKQGKYYPYLITRGEQKIFQLSVIWAIALAILLVVSLYHRVASS